MPEEDIIGIKNMLIILLEYKDSRLNNPGAEWWKIHEEVVRSGPNNHHFHKGD